MSSGLKKRTSVPSTEAPMATAGPAPSPAPGAPGAPAKGGSEALRWVKFAAGVAGIFFFYGTLYAEAQRSLTSEQPAAGAETAPTRFTNTAFVMLVQCTGNALFSVLMHALTVGVFGVCTRGESEEAQAAKAKREARPVASLPSFVEVLFSRDAIQCAFGYAFAMYSSNKALEFVSYPLQILAKSCKMIPVMAGGVLINGKRYKLQEYLAVVVMTAGVVYFSFQEGSGKKGHGGAKEAAVGSAAVYGYVLLAVSLALDGVSGPMQEAMNKYSLTAFQQNLVSNAWAVVFMGAMVVANNEWTTSFEYLRLHPSLYSPLLQFTIASACGQAFIFFVIREFGALMNTQVTTLRKLFTIVWTEVVSPKPGSSGLKMTQWAAVLLVFVGLYIGESAKSHGGGKAAGHAAVAGAPSAAQPSGDKAAEAAAPPGAKPAGKAAPSPQ